MCEPVTAPCGHTFCRGCAAGGYLPAECPSCAHTLTPTEAASWKNNVLLVGLVEKCRPDDAKTRCHLQGRLRAGEFADALRVANEGLHLVPTDQSLKSCRAEANRGLLRFSEALEDLDDLCCRRPNWTEGFFRKGGALLEMGHNADALIQFHRCLQLQADFVPAKTQIQKVLEAEGMEVPDDVSSIMKVASEYLKGPGGGLGETESEGREGAFLPAAEEEEEEEETTKRRRRRRKRDDGHGGGTHTHTHTYHTPHTHTFIIESSWASSLNGFTRWI
ncbi:LON peptidase N-terminal domain and RING finger protein 1 [Liparis tanakae]|uniref:LON peptidase N-terminal domain and RING finger protein 1 n=1 Tax=Liparis tanakae TaxID=230148 RepID=A0A4Z2GFI5_9TELE|nr:LON peptidase N-terminal domain and RING finger protein 1 [Liparis tanakae]